MTAMLIPTVKSTREIPGRGEVEVIDGALLDKEKELWLAKARLVLAPEKVPEALELFYMQEIDGRLGGLEAFLQKVLDASRTGEYHEICLLIDDADKLGFDWRTDQVQALREAWGEVLNVMEDPWMQDDDEVGEKYCFQANGIHTIMGKPITNNDPWLFL